jgi:eukaryotic-like serine/threonine-protein kinase
MLRRDLDVSADATRRFLREAQILGRLEHANIVPLYDLVLGPDGEPLHFTMKLVEGDTLHDRVMAKKPAVRTEDELRDLLHVLVKVCDAVSFAHSRGVVHRDLKPENVMIGTHGQVYVMDWGIASVVGRKDPGAPPVAFDLMADDATTLVGTPQYMAPEQAWGDSSRLGPRTDVFALGALLYFVLTGTSPHQPTSSREAWELARTGVVRPPHEVAPGVPIPPRLAQIAMTALAHDLEDRHESADAFKAEIERCLRSGYWFATKSFAPGTAIVQENDEGDLAFIVMHGTCEAYRGDGAERTVLRRMTAGDVFGEMALLTAGRRTASVVAIDQVDTIVVRREWLLRELGDDTVLAALVRTVAGRFLEAEQKLRDR